MRVRAIIALIVVGLLRWITRAFMADRMALYILIRLWELKEIRSRPYAAFTTFKYVLHSY